MVDDAGVVRDAEGLALLGDGIAERFATTSSGAAPRAWETANLYLLGAAVALAADRREESRGAHFRRDYPAVLGNWQRRQLIERGETGSLELSLGPIVRTDQAGLEELAGAFSPRPAEVRATG
jgi:L-aspartate oxidase